MGFDKVLCAKASSFLSEAKTNKPFSNSCLLQSSKNYWTISTFLMTYFLFHPHYILFLMEMSNAFFAKANWFNYNESLWSEYTYNPFLPKSLWFLLTSSREYCRCLSRIQGPALIPWLRDQKNLHFIIDQWGSCKIGNVDRAVEVEIIAT